MGHSVGQRLDKCPGRFTGPTGGFTLVEIMVTVAIIGLLAAMAIPGFARARENSQLNAIISNIRIIEGAKDGWALENKKGGGG